MKHFLLRPFLIAFCLIHSFTFGQNFDDTLIGLVDQELIKINKNDAGISTYIPISNYPTTYNLSRLSWSETNRCYYTIANVGGIYQIGKISESGIYSLLGQVNVPGQTVSILEGIAFNRNDSSIYVSASLNGGVSSVPPDYWSETLLKVDSLTLTGTVIGTFSQIVGQPAEADMLTFDDNGNILYMDAAPGSSNYGDFFKQIMDMSTPVNTVYNSTYFIASDLSVKNNFLYYSSNRILSKIELNTNTQSSIGQMFTSADFNGEIIKGITWKPLTLCEQEVFINTDTTLCFNDTLNLDASRPGNWNYLWSNGSTDSIITITTNDIYWVELSKDLCVYSDTINVSFSLPYLDAGLNDTICFGDSITLSAIGLDSGSIYTWNGSIINSVSFLPNNIGSQTYIVEGLDSLGCLNLDSLEILTVQYNSPTFSYSNYSFCLSSLDILPNNIFSTGGVFTANPLGLSVDSTTGLISPSNSLTNTYNLTYTTPGLCQSDTTINIEIFPLPIVTPILDSIFCEGNAFNFNSIILSNGASFDWTNSNTNIGLGANGSNLISTFNLTTINNTSEASIITITPSTGNCVGSTEDFEITVHPNPSINAGLDQVICSGDSIMLAGTSSTAPIIYTWDQGINNNTWFIPSNSSIYTLIGTDSNGCLNTDNVSINLTPIPTINAGSDATICNGDSINLNANSITPNLLYTWTPNVNNNTWFIPSVSGTYHVAATDINGCSSEDSLFVLINPYPTISAGNDLSICLGDSAVLSISNPDNAILNWTPQINADNSVFPSITTNYELTANLNGCISSGEITVLINKITDIDFTFNQISQNSNGTLFVFSPSTSNQNSNAYSWDFGNGQYSNLNSPIIFFSKNNSSVVYSISLTVTDTFSGCSITTDHTLELEKNIIFYVPNSFTPDNDSYNNIFQPIFTEGFDPYDFKLNIYNRWGEIIFTSNDSEIGWNGTYNGKPVQLGVYIWSIEYGTKFSDQKFFEKGHINLLK